MPFADPLVVAEAPQGPPLMAVFTLSHLLLQHFWPVRRRDDARALTPQMLPQILGPRERSFARRALDAGTATI